MEDTDETARHEPSHFDPNSLPSWSWFMTYIPICKYKSNFGEVAPHRPTPAPPHPTHPPFTLPEKVMFVSEKEINIGILSKAHAYSHMMHENLRSKGTKV